MDNISDEQFQDLINRAFDSLPAVHRDRVQNVAILMADEPTPEQLHQAGIRRGHGTLLGLYEGVPLSQRQGRPTLLPDRITLFKLPLLQKTNNLRELQEEIRHTLWHEVAHYYGLNHVDIRKLE